MVFLVIIYMLISLIYFIYWYEENRQEGIFKLSVVLFLPVFGYLWFFLLWLRRRYMERHNEAAYLTCDIQEDKIVNVIIKGLNEEKALNLVPMEEALLLNDNNIKRTMLLDMLKNDMSKYIFLLKTALCNEDTETSHYAATGIVEVKRKLVQSLQEWKQKYEKTKDKDVLIFYAYALKAYQSSGLQDEVNERKTMAVYQDILKELLEFYSQEEAFFTDRINYEIEAGDFENAGFYCKKFLEAHKQSEKPYLMYLKLFYSLGDKRNFNNMLQTLEGSTLTLSHSTWGIIKFWMEVSF